MVNITVEESFEDLSTVFYSKHCWNCHVVQFEKLENKPIVIGYGIAAVFALLATEWLIHLPGLNVVSAVASCQLCIAFIAC